MEREKYLPPEEAGWEPFQDFTKYFYNFLKIPKKEVFKGLDEERVKQIPVIIAGTMGIGKTRLVEDIVEELRAYYGEENTNVVYTQVSTEALLRFAFKGNPGRGWEARKPIQILVFDDATSVQLSRKDQRCFCSLRHQMMKETGLREGVIYSIFVTHDWYRLDPNFRRNALVTCFLSVSPLDQYSKREYSKFISRAGVSYLSQRLSEAICFDKEKGTGLVVLPFKPVEGLEKVGKILWKNNRGVNYIVIKEVSPGRLVYSYKINHPRRDPGGHCPRVKKERGGS